MHCDGVLCTPLCKASKILSILVKSPSSAHRTLEELAESRQPDDLKPLHLGQDSTFKNEEVAVQIVVDLHLRDI